MKRHRSARRICSSTAFVVKNILSVVEDEKAQNRLIMGLSRAVKRAVKYTDLGRRTIFRIKDGEEFPVCGSPEERESGMRMTEEESQWIRPVLVKMVTNKTPRTLDNILTQIKRLRS